MAWTASRGGRSLPRHVCCAATPADSLRDRQRGCLRFVKTVHGCVLTVSSNTCTCLKKNNFKTPLTFPSGYHGHKQDLNLSPPVMCNSSQAWCWQIKKDWRRFVFLFTLSTTEIQIRRKFGLTSGSQLRLPYAAIKRWIPARRVTRTRQQLLLLKSAPF